MRLLLVGSLALLMLLAAGLLLWNAAPPASQAALGAHGPASERAGATAPGPVDPGERRAPAATVADPAALAAATAVVPRAGRPFVAVDAATRRPLPGAQLWWLDGRRSRDLAAGESFERVAEDAGQTLRADSTGRGFLPPAEAWIVYRVAHDHLYGGGALDPDRADEVELALERDWTLEVEVVDGAVLSGERVHLRVGALTDRRVLWRGVTGGPRARAVLPHAQLSLPDARQGLELFVGHDFPHAAESAARIDPRDPPVRPVRLELPATGSLLLRFVDPSGRPLEGGARVVLRVGATTIDRSDRLPAFLHWPNLTYDVEGAELLLPRVATEVESLSVTVSPAAGGRTVRASVDGPTSRGQRVEAEIVVDPRLPHLSGRLVDAGGAPLAELESLARLVVGFRGHASAPSQDVTTDAEGRFSLPLETSLVGALQAEVSFETAADEGPPLRGEAALPVGEADRDLEVGDVVLAAVPLLAAGAVTDDAGAPLEGASVEVELEHADGADPSARLALRALTARTDARGGFRIYRARPDARLSVHAARQGHRCATRPLAFEFGAADLHLVLTATGSVEGSLSAGGDVPPGVVLCALEFDEPYGDRATARSRPAQDGSFELRDLPPGTWDFSVQLDGDPRPVLAIPGVVVRAGETTRDPRLVGIELGERVRRLVFEVVDLEGRPIETGWIRELSAPGPELVSDEIRSGRATLWARAEPLTLEFQAPAMRPRVVRGVTADARVELSPQTRFFLRLDEALELPPPGTWLPVALEPFPPDPSDAGRWTRTRREGRSSGMARVSFLRERLAFRSERTLVAHLPAPGTYSVSLPFATESGPVPVNFEGQPSALSVALSDEDAERTLVVHPDPAAYRAWLDELASD